MPMRDCGRKKHAQLHATRKRQEEKRKAMQAFVDRFRAKASKAKQAQSRLKALEKQKEIAAPVEAKRPAVFTSPTLRLWRRRLFGWLRQIWVMRKVRPYSAAFNLRIDQDDRVAILGPNGQGKSTLVKALSRPA